MTHTERWIKSQFDHVKRGAWRKINKQQRAVLVIKYQAMLKAQLLAADKTFSYQKYAEKFI